MLQHLLVQAQIGHNLFQFDIFILQLLQLPKLIDTQTAVLLLPIIERSFAYPICRQISAILTPFSPCLTAKTICASVNFVLFMSNFSCFLSYELLPDSSSLQWTDYSRGGQGHNIFKRRVLLEEAGDGHKKVSFRKKPYRNFCIIDVIMAHQT